MIIKFSNLVSLSEWKSNTVTDDYSDDKLATFLFTYAPNVEEVMWYRQLIPYEDYDDVILVSVRKIMNKNYCYANFYSQLALIHEYFPPNINGDFSFAKDYVDNFLIRMSNLKVYL